MTSLLSLAPSRCSAASLAPALASLLLVLGACGQGGPVTTGPSAGGPEISPVVDRAPGEVVLRVERLGGFLTPLDVASTLPLVSVYGDGRVITLDQPAPRPSTVPHLRVQQLDPSGLASVLELARAAGVGREPDVGDVPVSDAPTTRITLGVGGTEVLDVYALGEDGPGALTVGPGLTPEQAEARATLSRLVEGLQDLTSLVGPEAVDLGDYPATRVAVVTTPSPGGGGSGVDADPVAAPAPWPGPDLPGEPLEPRLDLSCLVVEGDDLPGVLASAARADPLTTWSSAGMSWMLRLRPLLPGEPGCEALVEQ